MLGTGHINSQSSNIVLFPTCVVWHGGEYFIVDNGNCRIVCTPSLLFPKYRVIYSDLIRPHTIRFVDLLTIIDDTDRHSIKVNVAGSGEWREIRLNGLRPHHMEVSTATRQLLVLCANSQTMHIFDVAGSNLVLAREIHLKFLNDCYTRSFQLDGDRIFFVPVGGRIIECLFDSKTGGADIKPVRQHAVPFSQTSGAFFYKVPRQERYYLGFVPKQYHDEDGILVYSRSLQFDEYRLLNKTLGVEGVPYSMTNIGGGIHLLCNIFKTSKITICTRFANHHIPWFSLRWRLPESGWLFEGKF